MPTSSKQQHYDLHPALAYLAAVERNLPKTTGRSMQAWVRIIRQAGIRDAKHCRAWLKQTHKLGGTTVALLTAKFEGKGEHDADPKVYLKQAPKYVESLYAAKPNLRPVHDTLIRLARGLGKDVKVCPCKTIIPLYRNFVFAQIKPTTKTRIHFGLALKHCKVKPPKTLKPTGGLERGDRITHAFALAASADITPEVKRWLKIAYEQDHKERA